MEQSSKIFKLFCYQNYCSDSYQILCSDKAHEVLFDSFWYGAHRFMMVDGRYLETTKLLYFSNLMTKFDEILQTNKYWASGPY